MYKIPIKLLSICAFSLCIFLLYIIQTQLYKIGLGNIFGEVFPAIDILVIYYFSSYKTIKYWVLFLLGILLDQFYQLPTGSCGMSFILANLILNYLSKWFVLKKYLTNLFIFCLYSLFIIGFRYFIFILNYQYNFDGLSIYFYYLTTILSYPLTQLLMHKSSTC